MSVTQSRRSPVLVGALVAILACVPAIALATPCYVVLDRNDAVVYQSPQPPVDMSSAGAAARDAMRKRGEVLLNFDSSTCAVRVLASRSGNAEASVDEIVANIKPYKIVRKPSTMSESNASTPPAGDVPITIGVGR